MSVGVTKDYKLKGIYYGVVYYVYYDSTAGETAATHETLKKKKSTNMSEFYIGGTRKNSLFSSHYGLKKNFILRIKKNLSPTTKLCTISL
jgi:hypothetical protein